MSESVFDKLLESYTGMRKRTWKPSLIVEAADAKWWATEMGLGDQVDPQTKITQYQTAKTNLQQASTQQGTASPEEVKSSLASYGQAVATNRGVSFVSKSGARSTKVETIPTIIQALDMLIAKTQEELGSEEDGKGATPSGVEAAPEESMMGFQPSERDEIKSYLEGREEGDSFEVETFIDKLQNTIITPLSRTKLGKLFEGRPDISPAIQTQLLDLTSRFFSMSGKLEKVRLADGAEVKIIRSEKLSSEDKIAAQVITVRGQQGDKGVYFGRTDGEFTDAYKELQEYSRAYDHKTYGFSLGASMSKYGGGLFDARILPQNVDPSNLTKEEFEKLDLAAQKSTAINTGSGGNDTKGKLAEDIFQLQGALLTGDAGQKKLALKELKTRLEKIASVQGTDIENLEAALLSGEIDDLESFTSSVESFESEVKRQLTSLVKASEKFAEILGISSVIKSDRPSADSKLGERTDNTYIIDNGSPLSKEFKDAMNDNEDGTYSVEVSMKMYDSPISETVLGSNSIHNAYGKGVVSEFDQLHEEHIDRAVKGNFISKEQGDKCRKAVEDDRKILSMLEDKLGSLTEPNKASLGTHIDSLLKNSGEVGFMTLEGRRSYEKELKDLKKSIRTEKNPRKAAVKLFQLSRIARAATDPEYGSAALVNDSVLSMGSFKNEVIMRGAPTEIALAQTHSMLSQIAQDAFSSETTISIGVSGVSMKNAEGEVLARNRIAGKERKQFAEGRIPPAGKEKYLKAYAI